jgi:hypothetical protein
MLCLCTCLYSLRQSSFICARKLDLGCFVSPAVGAFVTFFLTPLLRRLCWSRGHRNCEGQE